MKANRIQRSEAKTGVVQSQFDLAGDLFASGVMVQFCGVTAGLAGFVIFLISRLGYLNPLKKGLGPIWAFGWPVILAYIITFLSLFIWLAFKSCKLWSTPKAVLWYIYFVFICSDIILLSVLVWRTGGPRNSIFTPIFLLIPTVTACYCNPKKWFFRIVIIAILITFLLISYGELKGLTPSFMPENSDNPNKHLPALELFFSNAFTIFCIGTAAFCYYWTDRIRKNYCKNERQESSERPNVCNSLYL